MALKNVCFCQRKLGPRAKLLILHLLWILKLKVHVALLDMASNFAGDVWRDLSKSEELNSELHGTCFEFELKILL